MTDQEKAQIERINQVSAMARTSWIVLLGYLAFVSVTLLAVEDADFFLPTRQTQLPLVDVAIPTASFFVFAPVLAAALYIYLHIILLKLWDAFRDVTDPEVDGHPLGDVLNPWLVNDWALSIKGGRFVPARPLRALGNAASFLLVWAAGPLVLFGFWWRSMPAHDPWLTLLLATCFMIALTAGATNWRTAHAWLKGERDEPREHAWLWSAGAFLSAFATRHTVRERTRRRLRATQTHHWRDADVWYLGAFLVCVTLLRTAWPLEVASFSTLAPADLANVEMVDPPEGWRAWETARQGFRETWCGREGLDMAVCGQPADRLSRLVEVADRDRTPSAQARADWCGKHRIGAGQPCADAFADLDARFRADWETERSSAIADLPRLDLTGRDLRRAQGPFITLVGADLRWARLEGADLTGAGLEGADLREARLEGADLEGARLEGADLGRARLEGADLTGAGLEGADLGEARLEGADLSWARLEGADLGRARLEGADLFWAGLEGADLREARLEGANLSDARLEGANLGGARLEGADLSWARLEGADLRQADFRTSKWAGTANRASPAQFADFRGARELMQVRLEDLIGNESTLLPDGPSDAGEPWYVWSCWETPPPDLDRIVGPFVTAARRADLRAEFLCSPDNPRRKTGTPLALDAPYPEGHPLAGNADVLGSPADKRLSSGMRRGSAR